MAKDWYKELDDAYADEANNKWRRERKRKIKQYTATKRKKRYKGKRDG